MKYLDYKETRTHGTPDFPYAYYHITPSHPRYNMIYHWHTQYELIYVSKGSINMLVNCREYCINASEALFILGGMMHGGTPENAEYECLVFEVDANMRKNLMLDDRSAEFISNIKRPEPIKIFGDTETEALIKKIFGEFHACADCYRPIVTGAVMQLLGTLARRDNKQVAKADIRRMNSLKNALTYIEKHYTEYVTLDDIARDTGMNSRYLCKVFRDMTHRTPVDYLNYYRIECACEQLATTDERITDIALGCGFEDPSYFVKVFKRYKSVTPSQYLKNVIGR